MLFMSQMTADCWCLVGSVLGTDVTLLTSISSCLGILLDVCALFLFLVVSELILGTHCWMRLWQVL